MLEIDGAHGEGGGQLLRTAADQILIYLALAGGESSFTVRILTGHARTAMWLIEQFLPVRFETLAMDGKVLVRVVSRQRGRTRPA